MHPPRPNKQFYAVAAGRKKGIFTEWSLCNQQVDKFSGQCFRGFDSIEECEEFLLARAVSSDTDIMVYHKDSAIPLKDFNPTQHLDSVSKCNKSTDITKNNEFVAYEGLKVDMPPLDNLKRKADQMSPDCESDIYKTLGGIDDPTIFSKKFCDNMTTLFQYDKTSLTDFLVSYAGSEPSRKDTLCRLRLDLLDQMRSRFPDVGNAELINRHKPNTLSEDIYIMGYSIVNGILDKRLGKFLKSADSSHTLSDLTSQGNDNSELLAVCLALKDNVGVLTSSVKTLTNETGSLKSTVKSLTNEVCSLKSTIATLEARLKNSTPAPTGEVPVPVPNTPLTSILPTSPKPVIEIPDQNNEQDNEQTSHAQEFNDYQLSAEERRKIRRGDLKEPETKRKEVNGTSTNHCAVRGATRTYQTYIGGLRKDTTVGDVRSHLVDLGIDHVSDIILLPCRIPNQTSFCVSVDSKSDEDKIYTQEKWPLGIRIRQYHGRIGIQRQDTKVTKQHSGASIKTRPLDNSRQQSSGRDNRGSTYRVQQNRNHHTRNRFEVLSSSENCNESSYSHGSRDRGPRHDARNRNTMSSRARWQPKRRY